MSFTAPQFPCRTSPYMPTVGEYDGLASFLRQKMAELGVSANILINNEGEATVKTPQEIAALIASGVVWVDYCGWPMYCKLASGPPLPEQPPCSCDNSKSRFTEFLSVIGKPLASRVYIAGPTYVRFDPHNSLYVFKFDPNEYPWARGMMTDADITKLGFVIPPGWDNYRRASKVVAWGEERYTIYVYSCFGVRYGKGWYFWAWRGNPGPLKPVEGVTPIDYASFITATLKAFAVLPPPGGGGGETQLCTPPYPTLRYGDTGDCVRYAQQRLKAHGFDPGPVDGIFGTKTQQAVVAFQRANGLTPDGVIGPATWAKLTEVPPAGGGEKPPKGLDEQSCLVSGGTWTGTGCMFKPPQPSYTAWLIVAGVLALAGIGGYLLVRGGSE